MEIEKVGKRNVVFKYSLPEWGLNLHLIMGDKHNFIIDTGIGAESVAPIKDYLSGNPNPIIIINTHYHWDHIWGNDCFPGAAIISHRLCRELAVTYWDEMLNKNRHYVTNEVTCCLPNLLFEEGLYFPDDGVRVFYSPGHSADCISIYDEIDKVLNTGDNIGDTPEDIVPELEMEKTDYIKTLHLYKQLDVNACISGHNAVQGSDVFNWILKAV